MLNIEFWSGLDAFSLDAESKQRMLHTALDELHYHHVKSCQAYANLVTDWPFSQFPFVTARQFKLQKLSSIDAQFEFKKLHSSGTTGSGASQIILDKSTASLQSKALVNILQSLLGKERRSMLIVDHNKVIKDKNHFSARGAGSQGISFCGRNHLHLLDENMLLDVKAFQKFEEQYRDVPVLIFGFTFMVWQHLIQELKRLKLSANFKDAVLLHSGGWKKLEHIAVTNDVFKSECRTVLGNVQVHNFYGMVEQTGSIFLECEKGRLHCPNMADVIVRDPFTFVPLPHGETGVLQVLSSLPVSYPGHSILTEDLGAVMGEDDCSCGWKGKYFKVNGRLPRAEVRGCSDTV